MVMALKDHINIKFIHNRSEGSSKNHSVRIGMVQTGTVNILMEHYHTPFCIFVFLHCFFDDVSVCCRIVIVCVQDDKQGISVCIVIIGACCCMTLCISGLIKAECIWIIIVKRILFCTRVMISYCSGYRKGSQSLCAQISGIFSFIVRVVYLVSCRNHEAYITVVFHCIF